MLEQIEGDKYGYGRQGSALSRAELLEHIALIVSEAEQEKKAARARRRVGVATYPAFRLQRKLREVSMPKKRSFWARATGHRVRVCSECVARAPPRRRRLGSLSLSVQFSLPGR